MSQLMWRTSKITSSPVLKISLKEKSRFNRFWSWVRHTPFGDFFSGKGWGDNNPKKKIPETNWAKAPGKQNGCWESLDPFLLRVKKIQRPYAFQGVFTFREVMKHPYFWHREHSSRPRFTIPRHPEADALCGWNVQLWPEISNVPRIADSWHTLDQWSNIPWIRVNSCDVTWTTNIGSRCMLPTFLSISGIEGWQNMNLIWNLPLQLRTQSWQIKV